MAIKSILESLKKEDKVYFYLLIFIVVLFIINLIKTPILYHFTKFEKIITIKDKYTRYRKRSSNYNLVDTDGNVYKVGNLWFKFDFNRGNDYAKVDIGKKYKVKGYGYRAGILDSYQNIYELVEF